MVDDAALKLWFTREVLPLEPVVKRFLSRHARLSNDDLADLRQDVYERALTGARRKLPDATRGYILTIARNVLIDRMRRSKIVLFDQIADLDGIPIDDDILAAERHMSARDELRRALSGLDRLPPRCREVVRLRKVDGLSIQETAARLGIGHHTVERQLTLGLRALTDFMLGGEGRIDRSVARADTARKVVR